MKLTIPELALVVLIGPSGCGKSTFARKNFKVTEILSSDYCRGLVSDNENDQAATKDAFDVLHFIARKRLAAGKLTVVISSRRDCAVLCADWSAKGSGMCSSCKMSSRRTG